MQGHSFEIRALTIGNDFLYSSSTDSTIRIWMISTSPSNELIVYPTKSLNILGPAYAMAFHRNFLFGKCVFNCNAIASGWQRVVEVYSASDHKQVCSLESHSSLVCCLLIHNDQLLSGSLDKQVKVTRMVVKIFRYGS